MNLPFKIGNRDKSIIIRKQPGSIWHLLILPTYYFSIIKFTIGKNNGSNIHGVIRGTFHKLLPRIWSTTFRRWMKKHCILDMCNLAGLAEYFRIYIGLAKKNNKPIYLGSFYSFCTQKLQPFLLIPVYQNGTTVCNVLCEKS